MINEAKTLELYGYTSDSLSFGSHKKICYVCKECGKETSTEFRAYNAAKYPDLCRSCTMKNKHVDDPTLSKRKSICGKKYWDKNPEEGKRRGDALKKLYENDPTIRDRMSSSMKKRYKNDATLVSRIVERRRKTIENDPTIRDRMSSSMKKHYEDNPEHKERQRSATKKRYETDPNLREHHSIIMKKHRKDNPTTDETRQRSSAAQQHIPYDEWESFACEKKYCPKFDEVCREANRAKYNHECFICGLPQSENLTKTGKFRKLSVHHVDMDKAQGCDSNWKLVPLCMHHHATSHNDEIISRLGYLLSDTV